MSVDNIFSLLVIPGLEDRGRSVKRIRLLDINGRSLIKDIKKWQKSSPDEWRRIASKLRIIAEQEDLPKLSTV